jgi:hypothetical protein
VRPAGRDRAPTDEIVPTGGRRPATIAANRHTLVLMGGKHMRPALLRVLVVVGALAACTRPLPLETLAGSTPAFDPVVFFAGRTASWGVFENRSGEPTGRIVTESVGDPEGADGLHVVQRLTFEDGSVVQRDWHIRRVAPHRFEATANDMAGVAIGETFGRAFHWRWVLRREPDDWLTAVTLEQWMYLMDGGTMVNRTVITKAGVVMATVTEHFAKLP